MGGMGRMNGEMERNKMLMFERLEKDGRPIPEISNLT
jgi:hypothetical protein